MFSDVEILYKLMIMYMLKRVNFPLTNAQMLEFFIEKQYADYLTFQKAIGELVEANLVSEEVSGTRTRYELTGEGVETLGFFGNKISETIRSDIDQFIHENKYKMRNEIAVTAIYDRTPEGDYMTHMVVKEGKSTLIGLDLSLPNEEEAERVCEKWESESQKIYEFVVTNLLG